MLSLEWGEFHRVPHPSIYSVERHRDTCRQSRGGGSRGRWPAIVGAAWPYDPPPLDPRVLVAPLRWLHNRHMLIFRQHMLEWRSKCVTSGLFNPCVANLVRLSIDPSIGLWLVEEVFPRITEVVGGRGGTKWGRAVPRWRWPAPHYGPMATCHVHLLVHSMFVTFLGEFCIYYIQIILQAQVELGEFETIMYHFMCHFIWFLVERWW
jgi:hypothetical protein